LQAADDDHSYYCPAVVSVMEKKRGTEQTGIQTKKTRKNQKKSSRNCGQAKVERV
jgi:hypothetical protein